MLTVNTVVPSQPCELAVDDCVIVDQGAGTEMVAGRIGCESASEPPVDPNLEEGEVLVDPLTITADEPINEPALIASNTVVSDATVTMYPGMKPADESVFWAEVKLLGQLRECEQARDTIETTLVTHRATRARLQAELQQVESQIPKCEDLVDEAREQTLAIAKQLWRLKASGELPAPSQPTNEPPLTAASSQPEPEADESWRLVSTLELLTSEPAIAGLGKKKLENITEAAPTVGDLVDLISEGSKAHKQFHEMLPKGCGRGLADEIENRIGDLVIRRAKEASLGTVSALADELLNAQRQTAASEQWRPQDCKPSSDDSEHTKLGFAAFNEGKPHNSLPTQNRELARQWMLGWVCAEVIKHKSDQPAGDESELNGAESVAASDVPADIPLPQKKPRKARAKKAK